MLILVKSLLVKMVRVIVNRWKELDRFVISVSLRHSDGPEMLRSDILNGVSVLHIGSTIARALVETPAVKEICRKGLSG